MGRCPGSRLLSTDPEPRPGRIFQRDVAIVTCRSLCYTGLCICWTEAASASVCLAEAPASASAGVRLLLPLPLLDRSCSCACLCLCLSCPRLHLLLQSAGPRLFLPPASVSHLPLLDRTTSASGGLRLPAASCAGCPPRPLLTEAVVSRLRPVIGRVANIVI